MSYSKNKDKIDKAKVKITKSNGKDLKRIFNSEKLGKNSCESNSEAGRINVDINLDRYNNKEINSTCKISLPGIVNHGNTCYINSIIQCVNTIDSFVQFFVMDDTELYSSSRNKDKVLLLSFVAFLQSLWQKGLNCTALSLQFKKQLALTESSFCSNEQQDAQEFLLYLLNYFHENLKLLPKVDYDDNENVSISEIFKNNISSEANNISQQNRSIIYKLFATYQQLTIICPGCGSNHHRLESHLCLSLPVPTKMNEPLYYCFIEKDGSQLLSAVWINTISLVKYVRANIAEKFGIDITRVAIMLVNESGFGKYFQGSEQAIDLLDNVKQSQVKNLWNGVVALELSSEMSTLSFCEITSFESETHQSSVKQIKRSDISCISHIDYNVNAKESTHCHATNTREESNNATQSTTLNSKNNIPTNTNLLINLVIVHVEEININKCRRFSAPVSFLVRKEIEFKDLEKMVINQLEGVYSCNIQLKLNVHLRFWLKDGLNNKESEIKIDHQFPLLTEAVESLSSGSSKISIIRMACIWSPSNAALLMQAVFSNLRLSNSLGREFSKIELYREGKNVQSLSLMDAWSPMEKNESVDLIMNSSSSKPYTSQSKTLSLDDCIKAYVSKEILDAKDAWKCSKCHKFQRASISNSIYSLPEILVCHLKRFQSYSFNFNDNKNDLCNDDMALNNDISSNGSISQKGNSNNKIDVFVDYPLSGLNMRNYLSTNANKDSLKKLDASEYYYDLVAVCNHKGTLSSGHYTAFCRSSLDFKWRLFNDDVVKEVLPNKVIQSNAYILFYQRRTSIICHDQHWSVLLNTFQQDKPIQTSSTQHLPKIILTSEVKEESHVTKVSKIKCDSTEKWVSYSNKRVTDIKSNVILAHSNNNYNSVNNKSEDSSTSSLEGSTSYDEYIPTSVTKRPLRLPRKVRNNMNNIGSKSPNK